MANGHGGRRPGAGRPKKAFADKILEGNPGKRKPKIVKFQRAEDDAAPEMPAYLPDYTIRGEDNVRPNAETVWREAVDWLDKTGCLPLIHPIFITRYAILKSRWYSAERLFSEMGLIGVKNETVVESPVVEVSARYIRAANACWNKMLYVAAQNSDAVPGAGPNDDIERLIRQQWGLT